MDVQMPEMVGLEATRAIRKAELGKSKHIPILAITAHAMIGDSERYLAAGMDGYISNPVNAVDLLNLVEKTSAQSAASPPSDSSASVSPTDIFAR
jgi:CheY-like chemotaxis protein